MDGYTTDYDEVEYDDNLKTYTCNLTNSLTGYFTFKIKKVIHGTPGPDDKDEKFKFTISPYNGNNNSTRAIPEPVNPELTITGEGEATAELLIDNPGLYVYVIKESKGKKNYDYDQTERYILISMMLEDGKPTYNSWVGEVPSENEQNDAPVKSDVVTFTNKVIQKITYDLNGGEYDGSTDDIVEKYVYGSKIKIHEAPTREGYKFLYWKGSEYQPGDDYTVTEDHTFTAQWEKTEDVKKITYKLNGGKYNGSTDDIVEEYAKGTVIKIHEAPTLDGYTFQYWEGSEYHPGDSYTVTEDHTFTAQWKKNDDPPVPGGDTPVPGGDTPVPGGNTPSTADTGNPVLFIVLLIFSLIGIVGSLVIKKRRLNQ